jgi:hypothetical protein
MEKSNVSKKGKKQLKKLMTNPPQKVHGKAVMKDDPRKPGRKIGYATVSKTKLPDYKYKKKRATSTASKRSTKRKMY